MTALRPVETRDVVAVAAEEYPSNRICAHPECGEQVELRPDGEPTVHHGFSRSKIKSKSYFVSIQGGKPIPHAVGFCGSGTTKHHGALEDQSARLVLEDGVWYWEDRVEENGGADRTWERVGALNPQPGSREGRPKKHKRLKGEERKARKTISIRVPKDEPNVLDELLPHAQEAFQKAISEPGEALAPLPLPYVTIVAALTEFIQAHPVPKRRKK